VTFDDDVLALGPVFYGPGDDGAGTVLELLS
jgi:hypothetical protein